MEKRLKSRLYLLGGLVLVLAILLILLKYKDCGSDEACFNEYAANCKRARATVMNKDNLYLYEVQGRETEEGVKNCIVKVTLLRLEDTATPNLKSALEGRGMLCRLPRTLIAEKPLSHIENINDYCTGPLKEVLLEISLEKLYEVVVKNIGPISLQYSESLSDIDAQEAVTNATS